MISDYSVVLLSVIKEIVEAIYIKRNDCVSTMVEDFKSRIINEQKKR